MRRVHTENKLIWNEDLLLQLQDHKLLKESILHSHSTVEGVRMTTRAGVVVDRSPVAVLRNDGVLGLVVVRMLSVVAVVVPRKTDYGLRVTQVAVLLFPGIARVDVALEVIRSAHERVAIVLLIRE